MPSVEASACATTVDIDIDCMTILPAFDPHHTTDLSQNGMTHVNRLRFPLCIE